MTEALRVLPATAPLRTALLAIGAALVTVAIAVSLGNPNPIGTMALSIAGAMALIAWILHRPFHGFLVMTFTVFFLVVYAVAADRYLNAADLVLPVLGLVTWFGAARRDAKAEDARLVGPVHGPLRRMTEDLVRASIVFLSLMVVSIGWLAIRVGTNEAFETIVGTLRTMEGAAMLPLGLWWLRSEQRIHQTIGAACLAGALYSVVNLYQVFGMGTFRAGITWIFNHPNWPTECANEAALMLVMLWALIMARHHVRPSLWTYPALAVALLMLFLTQSRSGLLALILFTLLSLKHIRWKYLLVALLLVPIALQFVPDDFFSRIRRSITWEEGTYEVYSMVIRLYGYQSAFNAFLDNWFFGVGFFGLIYVSQNYNDLALTDLGAENTFLETAAGMGVIGLVALCWFLWRLLRVGLYVRRAAPPGTLGHVMGRFHVPYVLAALSVNMTGDNLIGIPGLGQLLLWTALVIRAGHLAIDRTQPERASRPEITGS